MYLPASIVFYEFLFVYCVPIFSLPLCSRLHRSDQARVRIHVEDANDNAPSFVGDDQFLALVKEEQDEGLLVTQLYAQDPDAGENATVTYHFVASDAMNDLTSFSLDPKTGVITTKRPLDYEIRRWFLSSVL